MQRFKRPINRISQRNNARAYIKARDRIPKTGSRAAANPKTDRPNAPRREALKKLARRFDGTGQLQTDNDYTAQQRTAVL